MTVVKQLLRPYQLCTFKRTVHAKVKQIGPLSCSDVNLFRLFFAIIQLIDG